MFADLERFWNGVARLDFFDEIVCDVMTQIRSLHGRAKVAGCMNVEGKPPRTTRLEIKSINFVRIVSVFG